MNVAFANPRESAVARSNAIDTSPRLVPNVIMLALRRLGSFIIDLALLAACAGLGALLPLATGESGWGVFAMMLLLGCALTVLGLFAQFVVAAQRHQTLGQRVIGLRFVSDRVELRGRRIFVRMVLMVLLPAAVASIPWGIGAIAADHIENFGTTHPDWQQQLDQSYVQRDNSRNAADASGDTSEGMRQFADQRAAETRIQALLAQRDQTLLGRIHDNAEELVVEATLLWLFVNGLLLFTRQGPIHDRICRVRVERGARQPRPFE